MIKQSTQGAVRVLSLTGALNEEVGERLRETFESMPVAGRPQLVLDLVDVPLVDSRGCEALLDTRDAVAAVGGAVHLAGLSPLCRDILTATGVIRYFPTFDCEKQAIAQFAK